MAVASLRHPKSLSAKCVSSSSSTVFPTIVFMPLRQKDFMLRNDMKSKIGDKHQASLCFQLFHFPSPSANPFELWA